MFRMKLYVPFFSKKYTRKMHESWPSISRGSGIGVLTHFNSVYILFGCIDSNIHRRSKFVQPANHTHSARTCTPMVLQLELRSSNDFYRESKALLSLYITSSKTTNKQQPERKQGNKISKRQMSKEFSVFWMWQNKSQQKTFLFCLSYFVFRLLLK